MKTFQDYIDQYGMSGYKYGSGHYAPLVVMLRDEVATPGSTQLSGLDRDGLVKALAALPGDGSDERALSNLNLPFISLRFDGSKVPILDGSDLSKLHAMMDAAYKQDGAIIYVHGELNNPFIEHTDRIENNGSITKNVSVTTDIASLTNYYQGAVNSTILGTNYYEKNNLIHNSAELTNMLKMVIETGVDTAEHVKQYFGNYLYAPGVADAAVAAAEVKLPVMPELSDPLAATLQKAYIAYFGRPADTGGLKYWVDGIHKTGTVDGMVDLFGNSDEYHNLYAHSSSTAVVNSLYQHLFNRDAEVAGLNFWVKNLDAGNVTLAKIAYELVGGAQNSDLTILNEKIAAASMFTASLDTQREVDLYSNNTSSLNARKWLSTVGADHNANIKIVGIASEIIDHLQSGVDGVLSAHGLTPHYY